MSFHVSWLRSGLNNYLIISLAKQKNSRKKEKKCMITATYIPGVYRRRTRAVRPMHHILKISSRKFLSKIGINFDLNPGTLSAHPTLKKIPFFSTFKLTVMSQRRVLENSQLARVVVWTILVHRMSLAAISQMVLVLRHVPLIIDLDR